MKIISHSQISSLRITPAKCVEWILDSFALKAAAQLPAKISVHPSSTDFFTSMPCLLPEIQGMKHRYFGIKEVHRVEGAVPSLGSDILLYDADNGQLLSLMDGNWITTMRTGAVAAVSARALRKSDACNYGFIGLGNTARAVLLCALEAEPERIFNVKLLRYKDQAESFAGRFMAYGNVHFEIVDGIDALVRDSDVLFSCITSADGLIVDDCNKFKAGITLIPVHMRGFQNCDTVFDRVFADDTDHVRNFRFFNEFNDYCEIGEVLAGRDPGRKSDSQRIIDYNYGIALHDILFASRIFELLSENGCEDVQFDKLTEKFWV